MMLIAVDAGHGWAEGRGDPGAVGGSGLMESDVTLLAALAMAGRLKELGHQTVMTRRGRGFVNLAERTQAANAARAAYFVSLHCNAAVIPEAHGSETLYFPSSAKGRELATRLQRALVSAGGRRDRGCKPRSDVHVLRATTMPAALVELAFISNAEEEQLLADEQWVATVARALAEVVDTERRP